METFIPPDMLFYLQRSLLFPILNNYWLVKQVCHCKSYWQLQQEICFFLSAQLHKQQFGLFVQEILDIKSTVQVRFSPVTQSRKIRSLSLSLSLFISFSLFFFLCLNMYFKFFILLFSFTEVTGWVCNLLAEQKFIYLYLFLPHDLVIRSVTDITNRSLFYLTTYRFHWVPHS